MVLLENKHPLCHLIGEVHNYVTELFDILFFPLSKKKKRSEVKGLPNYENIDCKTGIKPIILNMLRKKKR